VAELVLVGLAFDLGVIKNIQDAYRFSMEIWELGDGVFRFGVSRGAYYGSGIGRNAPLHQQTVSDMMRSSYLSVSPLRPRNLF
jgi:hypothetical protein